jgi:hypothetical protein
MITGVNVQNLFGNSSGNSENKISELSQVRTKNLNDYLKKDTSTGYDGINSFSMLSPSEGMSNLAPVERYQYMLNQARSQLKIDSVSKDPEESLKKANEIINRALTASPGDRPDNSEINMALLIKRMAGSKIDLAA